MIKLLLISQLCLAMDFYQALEAMMESSSTVHLQSAALRAAESSAIESKLFWTPSLSAEVGRSLNTTTQSLAGSESAIAIARLNLFKFGADWKALQAANAKIEQESLGLLKVQRESERAIAQALFTLIQARNNLTTQQKSLDLKETSVRVAQRRFSQGQLPKQEVDKAMVDRDASRIAVNEAELNLLTATQAVESVHSVSLEGIRWPWGHIAATQVKKSASKIGQLPMVLYYQAELEYFEAKSSASYRSGILPSLDIGSQWSNSKIGLDGGEWLSTLTLTIPLWDRMSSYGSARTNAEFAEQARIRLRQSRRDLELSAASIERRLELAGQNVLAAQKSVNSLNALYKDSQRRFELGRSSVNDLLVDESRFLEAEASLQRTLMKYHDLLVEQCHLADESLLKCYR